ncbi:MAG: hypothetical protein VR73_15800 [Gammaproteobacteria bacterium BRH_c0]|nr:MAG: hypothetical protein VR73_15800 [Gammaproteobacteria bacterium BRH_c0]
MLQLWWGFALHLVKRYKLDGCQSSAAALTYMSLFAVVPLLTLIYSVFSMVPAFQGLGEQVQGLIFRNLIPESGREVQQYLLEFSRQARKLSLLGAVILVVTAYLMLTNIEKTFNRMWGARHHRRGLSGFLLYWGILSIGPLLIGVGLMMHSYLLSLHLVMDSAASLGLTAQLLKYLPWIMTWMAFTLLFIAVPNCKVVFRYALIGGLVTTLLFQLVKGIFGALVADSSYYSVYGAFAALPLFLLWVHLCWMITLAGAELVRSLETFGSAYRGHRLPNLIAAVLVCWECWRHQQRGAAISDQDISSVGLEQQHWNELRRLMLKHRILAVTRNNHYVLTRDVSQLTLWQLIAIFGDNFTHSPGLRSSEKLASYPWFAQLDKLVQSAAEQSASLFSIPLSVLFQAHESTTSKEKDLNDLPTLPG